MKNLPYFLLAVLLLLNLEFSLAQPSFNGDGKSSSTAYVGTLPSYPPSQSWTGEEIYANDITIPSGVTLTIAPGLDETSMLRMAGFILTIEAGGVLILNPNSSATIGTIVNNGILRLESTYNEPGIASLLFDSYSGTTGTTQIKLYLTGGQTAGGEYRWHYISTPIKEVTPGSFLTQDLVQYVEELATANNNLLGWIAYDGFQYETGITRSEFSFDSLKMGTGYNYFSATSKSFTLEGEPNNGIIRKDLSYAGSSDAQGYNLVGNPFVSCVNWETLINNLYLTSVDHAIYFTNNGAMAAYVSGVSVLGATEFIPPMQGFFVKANAAGARIIFHSSAKTHRPGQNRYKKKSTAANPDRADTISLVRLVMTLPDDKSELVVRFNKKATNGFDPKFDAYAFSRTMGDLNMWTTTGSSDYAINALPFPNHSIELPVGVNMKVSGTFRLVANEIKKLDDYNVFLKDLETGQVADLRKGEAVEFTSDAGMIENRFLLVITKSSTGIDSPEVTGPGFRIFALPGKEVGVQATGGTDELIRGDVEIYDLSGKRIMHKSNIEWAGSGDIRQFPVTRSGSGIYMVVVNTGQKQYTEKVAIQ